ncbi:MAG: AzlC family ABC transporter permease [Eubacteriales bacterium]|nr:AzlC family ABC transporter permease [Eubacteriales bacterium]
MKTKALRAAFPYTLPVMLGYLFLGAAFGILLSENGFAPGWAFLMSVFIYAGSMQFAAIGLMTGPFAPISALLLTLMVNARHLFYGLSMLEPFRRMGKRKPYMIFSLTDETYSLLCSVQPPEGVDKSWFLFFISLLDQLYWIIGSCIGAFAKGLLPFDSTGIDFSMTALFLVIFVEQWEKAKSKLPALLGLGITAICLLVFGSENFLIFSMAGILISLLLFKKEVRL